jgi:hypothetical protein
VIVSATGGHDVSANERIVCSFLYDSFPFSMQEVPHLMPYIISVIYFPCIVALFVLNIWADVPPKYKQDYEFVEVNNL